VFFLRSLTEQVRRLEKKVERERIVLAALPELSLQIVDFFRVTRRLTRDQRELKKAVQRCAFNILMNNRDDHAKNLSFLLQANGSWQLALLAFA